VHRARPTFFASVAQSMPMTRVSGGVVGLRTLGNLSEGCGVTKWRRLAGVAGRAAGCFCRVFGRRVAAPEIDVDAA
jgi:hypothetical protein